MYVRRWPRISASSRTPPSDMRTNSRPVARAIDSPIEVLPVPGGPISVRIAPERLSSLMPALGAQLLDRQVLRDAVLDVLEAGVVGVEHLAGGLRIELLVGGLAATARRSASRGRCGSCSPRRTARPCARVARAPSWPAPAPPPACRPRRSSCGTPRRPRRRPRPARAGSTPSACAGCTRAAACPRRTGRPRGSSCAAAARSGARAGARRRSPGARRRRASRARGPCPRRRRRARSRSCRPAGPGRRSRAGTGRCGRPRRAARGSPR